MQSMIVARLLATRDLLLNRYSHHISILNLQFAHRLSPREKNDAMISLCCIISVVVFRRMWLGSFRGFAWGLQRLGKMVGSVDLNKKPRVDPDPVVEAYIQYGKQVGWSDQTLHSHLRYLYSLRRFLILLPAHLTSPPT